MRCPNISGRVQSGLTSTSSCTAACEAKFSLIVTLGRVLVMGLASREPNLLPKVSHFVFGKNTRSFGNYGIWKLSVSNKLNSLGRALPTRAAIELSNAMNMILPRIP